MSKKGYLLDTHILTWILFDDKRLNKNVKESVEYFQHNYYVSVASLHEYVHLMDRKKLSVIGGITTIISQIEARQLFLLDIKPHHIKVLEKLSTPFIGDEPHKDHFDRIIISQGIAEGLTVISADTVFPKYHDKGFKLLEV